MWSKHDVRFSILRFGVDDGQCFLAEYNLALTAIRLPYLV